MKNRAFVASLFAAATLVGCGGESVAPISAAPTPVQPPTNAPTPPPPPPPVTPPPPPPTVEWVVTIPALVPGQSFTIEAPAGVRAGGTFAISETGTQLPTFITLSTTGVVTIASDLVVTPEAPIVVQGIIFVYQEPL